MHIPQGLPGGTSGKESPANAESLGTWIQSLGQKDPLEEGMATHSSILASYSHGQKSLAAYKSMGVAKESDSTEPMRMPAHIPQL